MAEHTPQPPLPPDRHPGWEGLYLATEIKRCVDLHQSTYEHWLAGGSLPSLVLEVDPADDLSERDDQVVAIVMGIERLFSPAVLEEAIGKPGEPGDDEKIAAVAAAMGTAFGDLVDWGLRTRGAEAPAEWRGVYRALAQIVATPLRQIREFADGFCAATTSAVARQRAGEDAGAGIEMVLTVSIPDEDVAAFSRALAEVKGVRATAADPLLVQGGASGRRARASHLIRWMLVGVVIAVSLRMLGIVG